MSDKNKHPLKITDRTMLDLYESILPLLSNNPDNLEIVGQINQQLVRFVFYDSFHFLMDDVSLEEETSKINTVLTKWGGENITNQSTFALQPVVNLAARFEELVSQNYQKVFQRLQQRFPPKTKFDYVRMESEIRPRIVVGFFRHKTNQNSDGFTKSEKQLLECLKPHIFLLLRTVLRQDLLSQGFQYFSNFSMIGSRLAEKFELSDAEVKLLPDILFGYTNEQIAERQFVSVATVKSHINHILRKTGARNRLDFVGTFFILPDRVEL